MPNGLNISRESDTWRALESPLLRIDPLLSAFAERHGMHLSRNHHNWPERTLGWSSKGLRRSIQIALADPKEQTYSVRVCASTGVGQSWLSNESFLREAVPWPEIAANFQILLTDAYETAERWSEEDLSADRRIDVGDILRRRRG